jgi:pyruvate,orthophosphate dikinase
VELSAAGLSVPPGFVLETELCRQFLAEGPPAGFRELLVRNITALAAHTGRQFGATARPLFVSVRSGSPVSMPGMLDTVLNIGLTRAQESGVIRLSGRPRLFWDAYRRLVREFGETVEGVPPAAFDGAQQVALRDGKAKDEHDLDTAGLGRLTGLYLEVFERMVGRPFPDDPIDQLESAVGAVFRSWHSPRAVEYRRLQGIAEGLGTAVTVQAMVFGNRGRRSGTGVAFTRDPATGVASLYADFLPDAQGEDVVSGRRTAFDAARIADTMPDVFAELVTTQRHLEELFGNAQDFEFTVEEGKLWILQSRDANCTSWAALRIALDLHREGVIDRATARTRIGRLDLGTVVRPRLDFPPDSTPVAHGIGASPGGGAGLAAFSPEHAIELARQGRRPILVRPETSTDDLGGLAVAAAVLTAVGSRTSHAAVVARHLNVPCVVGCRELSFVPGSPWVLVGGHRVLEDDPLSLDGNTGAVYLGSFRVVLERPERLLAEAAALLEACPREEEGKAADGRHGYGEVARGSSQEQPSAG